MSKSVKRFSLMRGGALVALVVCPLAVGCGGNEGSGRVPNRAPVVAKDSLSWLPDDAEVRPQVQYTYSVTAADPDVGDRVVRYEWVFGNAETGVLASYETAAPSVGHTFSALSLGDGVSAVAVQVRAADNKGAVGQYEVFTVPVAAVQPPAPNPAGSDLSGDHSDALLF